MGWTGKFRPDMCPTSRAHRPPQLTMYSALMVPLGVVTSHVPSARWVVAVAGVWVKYCAP